MPYMDAMRCNESRCDMHGGPAVSCSSCRWARARHAGAERRTTPWTEGVEAVGDMGVDAQGPGDHAPPPVAIMSRPWCCVLSSKGRWNVDLWRQVEGMDVRQGHRVFRQFVSQSTLYCRLLAPYLHIITSARANGRSQPSRAATAAVCSSPPQVEQVAVPKWRMYQIA